VKIIREAGNWPNYRVWFRLLPDDEIDLHRGRRDQQTRYEDAMAEVEEAVLNALSSAVGHTSCSRTGRAHRERGIPRRDPSCGV
jgi:hypothetical protein